MPLLSLMPSFTNFLLALARYASLLNKQPGMVNGSKPVLELTHHHAEMTPTHCEGQSNCSKGSTARR
jgi:hypothetical protein